MATIDINHTQSIEEIKKNILDLVTKEPLSITYGNEIFSIQIEFNSENSPLLILTQKIDNSKRDISFDVFLDDIITNKAILLSENNQSIAQDVKNRIKEILECNFNNKLDEAMKDIDMNYEFIQLERYFNLISSVLSLDKQEEMKKKIKELKQKNYDKKAKEHLNNLRTSGKARHYSLSGFQFCCEMAGNTLDYYGVGEDELQKFKKQSEILLKEHLDNANNNVLEYIKRKIEACKNGESFTDNDQFRLKQLIQIAGKNPEDYAKEIRELYKQSSICDTKKI